MVKDNISAAVVAIFFFLSIAIGWLDLYFENSRYILYFFSLVTILLFRVEALIFFRKITNSLTNHYLLLIAFSIVHLFANQQFSISLVYFFAAYFFSHIVTIQNEISKTRNKNIIFYGVFFSCLITLIGVYLGFFESIFFKTDIFHSFREVDYPNPTSKIIENLLGFKLSNSIHGFQISINYTAYILLILVSIISVTSFEKKTENIILFLSLFALFLTQAKIGFLFLAIFITKKFCAKIRNSSFKFILFCIVIAGYLFLTHITIKISGSGNASSFYFRELIFTYWGYDFYLSLFSFFKLNALDYLLDGNFLYLSLENFYLINENQEPHSLFFSQIFSLGIFASFIFFVYLYKNVYRNVITLFNSKLTIFFSAYVSLLVESFFLWDSYDSFIYWIYIISVPTFLGYSEKPSKII